MKKKEATKLIHDLTRPKAQQRLTKKEKETKENICLELNVLLAGTYSANIYYSS